MGAAGVDRRCGTSTPSTVERSRQSPLHVWKTCFPGATESHSGVIRNSRYRVAATALCNRNPPCLRRPTTTAAMPFDRSVDSPILPIRRPLAAKTSGRGLSEVRLSSAASTPVEAKWSLSPQALGVGGPWDSTRAGRSPLRLVISLRFPDLPRHTNNGGKPSRRHHHASEILYWDPRVSSAALMCRRAASWSRGAPHGFASGVAMAKMAKMAKPSGENLDAVIGVPAEPVDPADVATRVDVWGSAAPNERTPAIKHFRAWGFPSSFRWISNNNSITIVTSSKLGH